MSLNELTMLDMLSAVQSPSNQFNAKVPFSHRKFFGAQAQQKLWR
jgi:hypothetical protein